MWDSDPSGEGDSRAYGTCERCGKENTLEQVEGAWVCDSPKCEPKTQELPIGGGKPHAVSRGPHSHPRDWRIFELEERPWW
jgi:hypothetical protein